MEKQTSNKYSTRITSDGNVGVDIVLKEESTGRTKEFHLEVCTVENATYFMNSLTDICCSDFFGKQAKGR